MRQRRTSIPTPLTLLVVVLVVFVGAVLAADDPNGSRDSDVSVTDLALLMAPSEVYNPVAAGEELPEGYRQIVSRDAIRPVYEPSFVAGSEIDWPKSSLVIGVEIGGVAKAYPVAFLNRREMVIDRVAGIPVLVTW